jgi:hypothetical protein
MSHPGSSIDVRSSLFSAAPINPGNANDNPEVLESDNSSESYVPSADNGTLSDAQEEDDRLDSSDEDENREESKKPARWCSPAYKEVLLRYFDEYHATPGSERGSLTYKVVKKLRQVAQKDGTALPRDLYRVRLLHSPFC